MSPGLLAVVVALTGGLGAALRLVVDGALRARAGGGFPVATVVINLSGSLLLGLLVGLAGARVTGGPWPVVIGSGLLGGYTTFSTASFETARLLEERRYLAAAINGLGVLAAAVALAALGFAVGTALG